MFSCLYCLTSCFLKLNFDRVQEQRVEGTCPLFALEAPQAERPLNSVAPARSQDPAETGRGVAFDSSTGAAHSGMQLFKAQQPEQSPMGLAAAAIAESRTQEYAGQAYNPSAEMPIHEACQVISLHLFCCHTAD